MGDIFAIGDIHGSFAKLSDLVSGLPIRPEKDTIVFVGDYIDRGPDSYKVVDFLIRLGARYPRVVFLKGNHEDMLLRFLKGADREMYLANGGEATLASYRARFPNAGDRIFPEEHLAFFDSLKLYHETDDYLFVHAGFREKRPLARQKPEDLLWIRKQFIDSDHDFGKRVVFGHTPFVKPLVQPNKIGIDTGAVFKNKLTCVKLPHLEFYNA